MQHSSVPRRLAGQQEEHIDKVLLLSEK